MTLLVNLFHKINKVAEERHQAILCSSRRKIQKVVCKLTNGHRKKKKQ